MFLIKRFGTPIVSFMYMWNITFVEDEVEYTEKGLVLDMLRCFRLMDIEEEENPRK